MACSFCSNCVYSPFSGCEFSKFWNCISFCWYCNHFPPCNFPSIFLLVFNAPKYGGLKKTHWSWILWMKKNHFIIFPPSFTGHAPLKSCSRRSRGLVEIVYDILQRAVMKRGNSRTPPTPILECLLHLWHRMIYLFPYLLHLYPGFNSTRTQSSSPNFPSSILSSWQSCEED